jgi:iron(III) transport system substrate-binding protein
MRMRAPRLTVVALLVTLAATGCSSAHGGQSNNLTLYTCVTDTIEQAVIKAYKQKHPGVGVDVFRAPTGQLNARVAADVRAGGIKANVIWACDPLTMHGYDAQGLLRPWTASGAADLDPAYRTQHFVGVDLLYLVAVVHKGVTRPASWADLTKPEYRGGVALPSPSFAASALGMLGYFASAPGYGMAYYEKLKSNGAKQVNSPDNVLTGVAQGTYRAGFTLANAAYAAQNKGSPIDVVWPSPGAIAIYAPIAVTTKKGPSTQAADFAAFVASREGQTVTAKAGAYVPIKGLAGPPIPAGSPIVSPDWPSLFGNSASLLGQYAKIFGG